MKTKKVAVFLLLSPFSFLFSPYSSLLFPLLSSPFSYLISSFSSFPSPLTSLSYLLSFLLSTSFLSPYFLCHYFHVSRIYTDSPAHLYMYEQTITLALPMPEQEPPPRLTPYWYVNVCQVIAINTIILLCSSLNPYFPLPLPHSLLSPLLPSVKTTTPVWSLLLC